MSNERFVYDGKNIYDTVNDKYLESVWEIVDMLNRLDNLNTFNILSGSY